MLNSSEAEISVWSLLSKHINVIKTISNHKTRPDLSMVAPSQKGAWPHGCCRDDGRGHMDYAEMGRGYMDVAEIRGEAMWPGD